jgi:hypothetical protein
VGRSAVFHLLNMESHISYSIFGKSTIAPIALFGASFVR